MERLTDEDGICTDCEALGHCTNDCRAKMRYDKLKEYEDAEEQKLLLRLPCKVGDYVWDLWSGYRFEVMGIELHMNGLIIFRCGNKGTEDYASFYLDEIGERWSLSEPQGQAEAEKALEAQKALAEMG